ncbi:MULTISPECIES: SDR family NAD(P)-dependent oxidoreductase [unclassified Streptosporangium]|uniref:SDR family NAD(P)-dependent oxidoreductase n=1 Tax=unclassified Streptosporangium TaxID=2632669 RepID=UPI002E2BA90B|nr:MULTISPECIES: SDR family NAD(P)-dependent oxidoreductase [unclassified Streptosporangium]
MRTGEPGREATVGGVPGPEATAGGDTGASQGATTDHEGTPDRSVTASREDVPGRGVTTDREGTPDRSVTASREDVPGRGVTTDHVGTPDRSVTTDREGVPGRGVTAVVGGGAAGIAAAKALVEAGLPVLGVERAASLGGLWRLDGDTASYEGLRLNTSKPRTEFSDFPMPAEWPDYPTRAQMLEYLRSYADRFGVGERFRFGTTLESARRTEDGWELELTGPGGPYRETVEHLVVANGHNHEPRLPEPPYPGTFTGTESHAHDYVTPAELAGKRVLVVGTGNSAMDIATELAGHASAVLLSARRGVWVLPKRLLGRPSDQLNGALAALLPWRVRQVISQAVLRVADRKPAGPRLPDPRRGVLQDHPTLSDSVPRLIAEGRVLARQGIARLDGSRVQFADGRVDEVDHIVWCTGYRAVTPFLDAATMPDPASTLLYRHVFPVGDDSISYVGLMQSTGSALPVVEAQGRLVAAVRAGTHRLPDPGTARRIAAAELDAARDRWGQRRPHMRIDVDQYLRVMDRELRAAPSHALAGRRILVTGAAGTFGRAMSARFTAQGAHVVGLDIARPGDSDIPIIACDITSQESVDAAVTEAAALLGGIDLLVNNAGRGGPAPAELAPGEEVEAQLRLNLLGAWRVTATVMPHLVRTRGRVVFIASRMAVLPLPLAAAYGVSKRALAAYADALRLEVGTHVGVTTVYPSMVRSPIHDSTRQAGLSLDAVSRPEPVEGVVDAIVRAVTARRAPRDVATTVRGRVEMMVGRHVPSLADRLVRRTVAARVAAGDFANAPLAAGMVSRHRS